MGTETQEKHWVEVTYGARWPSDSSAQRYQIYQMECIHCDFKIDPGRFRMWSDHREDHPQPYGNFASISHARKLMRDHVKTHKGVTRGN